MVAREEEEQLNAPAVRTRTNLFFCYPQIQCYQTYANQFRRGKPRFGGARPAPRWGASQLTALQRPLAGEGLAGSL